jgi:hypothetical protein
MSKTKSGYHELDLALWAETLLSSRGDVEAIEQILSDPAHVFWESDCVAESGVGPSIDMLLTDLREAMESYRTAMDTLWDIMHGIDAEMTVGLDWDEEEWDDV